MSSDQCFSSFRTTRPTWRKLQTTRTRNGCRGEGRFKRVSRHGNESVKERNVEKDLKWRHGMGISKGIGVTDSSIGVKYSC
jgi:hypothetical protein